MNYHDPYSGHQIRALRSDPTGRHSPITEREKPEPWWLGYLIGIAGGCVLALMMWAAI